VTRLVARSACHAARDGFDFRTGRYFPGLCIGCNAASKTADEGSTPSRPATGCSSNAKTLLSHCRDRGWIPRHSTQLAHVRWSGCLLGKEALRVRFPTWARSASLSSGTSRFCTPRGPVRIRREALCVRRLMVRPRASDPMMGVRFTSHALDAAVRTVTVPECHSGREGSTPSGRSDEPIFRRRTWFASPRSPVQLRVGSPGEARAIAPSLRARPGGSRHGTSKAVDSFRLRASALTSSFRRIRTGVSETSCPGPTPGDETSPPADLVLKLRTSVTAVQLGPGRPRSGVDLVARWAHNPPDAGCDTGLRNRRRRPGSRALS
jgi:hypothetical protein